MNRRSFGLFAVSALVPVLVSGCGLRKDGNKVQEPVPVRVVTVEETEGVGARSYVGTVAPSKSAVLSCSYSGTLVRLAVSEGDFVRKGDTVAVIESQSVKSMRDMAHATLRQAEDGYERLTQVHGSGSVADVKMVEIETQLSKARASAEAADKALEDCTLKAPFDGVIGDVFVEQGVDLSVMEPVVRILDISSVKVEISVPENEFSAMDKGDRASVNVPALDGRTFGALLRTKGLVASPVSHSYRFDLEPAERVPGLMPGMVCKVVFDDSSSGMVIAASAVRTDMDGRYVWAVRDGKVRKAYVTIGGFSGEGVIVESGLAAGDKVIVEGGQKVSGGMSVKEME